MKEFHHFPLTYSIIFLNTFFYFLLVLFGGKFIEINLNTLIDFGALYGPLVVFKGEWWRLLSAMFLHGNITHILMNMASLYIIGRSMEHYFSKFFYIIIYLFSGLIGAMTSLYMHPQSVGIGASGAIFGVFGALGGFFLVYWNQVTSHSREIIKNFSVMLGLNFILGLSIASIDMSAHIGGLIVGFISGFVLTKYPHAIIPFSLILGTIFIFGTQYLYAYYLQIFMSF
ncbi:MAG: rhomboid family intramembrane serine protease [Sulfurovum sp.]|nr:rhomboid family intramembrane serine protease [Sulfurovum sp.]